MTQEQPIQWMDYEEYRAQQAWFDQWPNVIRGYTWDTISGKWIPPDPPLPKVTESYNTKL